MKSAALPLLLLCPLASAERPLDFEIREGAFQNRFVRRGGAAAHLLASSGDAPKLIVAFPAANSGIGLWFERPGAPVALELEAGVEAVERGDGMRGAAATLAVGASSLRSKALAMSSVRVLRDYVYTGVVPPELAPRAEPGPPLRLRRRALDGRHGFELSLEGLDGARASLDGEGRVLLTAAPGASRLRVRVTALTDYEPLTPMPLVATAADRSRELDALEFLSYKEKYLAGSWRFLTYFGRDTLLSIRLLLPVLAPEAVEAGLGSVLDRLGPDGEVAHEEDIGEFAALRRVREGGRPEETPYYDYKMIDGDFLLAPVAAEYLLGSASRERREAFLARRTPSGLAYARALALNLERVRRLARPYAEKPGWERLIAIKHETVGNWRDSDDGLGRGRFPYDVNAALVPAALAAGARLHRAGLASPAAAPEEFERLAAAWKDAARRFRVDLPAPEAASRLRAYAAESGLKARAPGRVSFHALALDAKGEPIPVMHTDEGFLLLFAEPPPEALERAVAPLGADFPAGLASPVGVPVANPAYSSDPALRARFSRAHYHGAVIWSWQQALLAAGLSRQLSRADLPPAARSALRRAQSALWKSIDASAVMRHSELWSWRPEQGRMALEPFGQGGGHHDESNAAQLWSTVWLAVDRLRPAK